LAATSTPFSAEAAAPSASLRKELGFTDIILASVLLVVIPDFFGTAVKAGPAHVLLWCLAIALFFIPQALVVTYLNGSSPTARACCSTNSGRASSRQPRAVSRQLIEAL